MVVQHPRHRRRYFLATLVIGLACLGLRPALARAQVDALPTEITTTQVSLTPAQADTVKVYAQKYLAQMLESPDTDEAQSKIQAARKSLLSPLTSDAVTPSFRFEYSKQLIPKARAMVDSGKPYMVIQALQLAAGLATIESLDLAEGLLDNSDDSVRYSAAAAIRTIFETIERSAPAISQERLDSSLTKIAAALQAEKRNGKIVESLARAAQAGMAINRAKYEDIAGKAMTVLADSLGRRVQELGGAIPDREMSNTLIVSAGKIRDALGNAAVRISPAAVKAAAGLAGDILANSIKVVNKGGLKAADAGQDDDRSITLQLCQLAEQIISLAPAKIGGGNPAPHTDISSQLRSGTVSDDAKFTLGAQNIITGQLTRPPMALPADRFK